jgi:hypothetical protein
MLVDMELVAQAVKYAGDNKQFLRPQYTLTDWEATNYIPKPDDESGKFTFLK